MSPKRVPPPKMKCLYLDRSQGRRNVRKSGGLVVMDGDNVPPLVEIGLTDLPKTGGALAPPAPPLVTALTYNFI